MEMEFFRTLRDYREALISVAPKQAEIAWILNRFRFTRCVRFRFVANKVESF